MIQVHILTGVLLALAVLIGATVALSAVMLLATRVTGSGRAPHGGIRRDLPQQPQPDPDDARELVLI
jgi:hypothetical protein